MQWRQHKLIHIVAHRGFLKLLLGSHVSAASQIGAERHAFQRVQEDDS